MIGIVERILGNDDYDRDRKLIREALESEVYSVEETADGTDALRVLFASCPWTGARCVPGKARGSGRLTRWITRLHSIF